MNTQYFYTMKHWVFILIILTGCSNPIETVLASKNDLIKKVVSHLDKHEVQIIFTQIDTTSSGEVSFIDHEYNVDKDRYFYPASTVKLPVAILAAEYMDMSEHLNIDVPYITERDEDMHAVANDIQQIFAVNDNEAYNRLYEILGRDYINTRLRKKDIDHTRISHRLSTPNAAIAQRSDIHFFPSYTGDAVILKDNIDSAIDKVMIKNIKKGNSYIEGGTVIKEPMDFSEKNYFPLIDQHNLMKRLLFPEHFSSDERFDITEQTRTRLLSAMQTVPHEANYKAPPYYDSYVKFFIYGDSTEPIPSTVHIYNKVGYAYGTLTETAYVVDTKNNIQFLLSATILVNENGILNDNTYEYETIGIPFLAQLGREFYELEKEQK